MLSGPHEYHHRPLADITFRVLYVFLVLRHDRRRVVHFNVTTSPTARWAAQQIVEAFPFEEVPRFVLRDRDSIYGQDFRDRVKGMEIEEVLIAPRSPWQNPYVERLIGSIRRECLDHVIVLNEDHLLHVLDEYFGYYHEARALVAGSQFADSAARLPAGAGQGYGQGVSGWPAPLLYASGLSS